MAVRRYRGYKIEVERNGEAWDVTVTCPTGEVIWDDGEYVIYQDAFEEAKYAIDEHIEELEAPVAMYEGQDA